MNTKELEALVLKQGTLIEEMQARIQTDPIPVLGDAVQALEKQVLEQRAVINEQAQVIVQAVNFFEIWPTVQAVIEELGRDIGRLQGWIGADDIDGPFNPEFKAITARLAQLETLVLARNASAATKRNMTDEDALRVLTGDLKELSHKDAAEKAGLTYAQVYSCRLEFTFKHVHKTLRDASTPEAPWKNAWVK